MRRPGDGGPAFPRSVPLDAELEDLACDAWVASEGMSLRDYFAAQSLGGLRTAPGEWTPLVIATYAYAIADAMLEARRK